MMDKTVRLLDQLVADHLFTSWYETDDDDGRTVDETAFDLDEDRFGPQAGYEARCGKCGESFNPVDPDDLEHLVSEDGTPCSGTGVIVGAWS